MEVAAEGAWLGFVVVSAIHCIGDRAPASTETPLIYNTP